MTTSNFPPGLCHPSPSWASHSHFQWDTPDVAGVWHSWTPPTSGKVVHGGDEEPAPAEVQIARRDELVMTIDGIAAVHDKTVIFLATLDAEFTDTAEARKFAQAILECCDRIEEVADEKGVHTLDTVTTADGAHQ